MPFDLPQRDELRRDYYSAGYWRDHLLQDYVDSHPADRVALIDGDTRLTYGELQERSAALAQGLQSLGVQSGDVVSVQLPNWHEFSVVLLALERLGAVINPLTPILRRRELAQMLGLARSRLLIVPEVFRSFSHLEMALDLARELPDLQHVVVVRGGRPPDGAVAFESLLMTSDTPAALSRPSPDAVTELAFSSGTTGQPKGVLHTHNSALCCVGSTIRRMHLTGEDVVHIATPVGHNAGYFYGVRIALQAGATAVFQDAWNGERMAELVQAHAVSFSMGSTTFLLDFLQAVKTGAYDVSSMRVFTCGGATIPPIVAEECERLMPGVLCPVFGMTEMGHSTCTPPEAPRSRAIYHDGLDQPEMSSRIVDESGQDVEPGRVGRLMFKGPFLFAGYLQGSAFTEACFNAEGYFDTGDLAFRTEDGYLRIAGRVKDLIIRGGENIPVREIEDLLVEHPKVVAAAVVGIPDPRLGERAVACVCCLDGRELTLAEMQEFLAGRQVTRQFWPEGVENFDAFPLTPAGKVQKFELQRLVLARRQPEPS